MQVPAGREDIRALGARKKNFNRSDVTAVTTTATRGICASRSWCPSKRKKVVSTVDGENQICGGMVASGTRHLLSSGLALAKKKSASALAAGK
jgi:hypothetical protein